MFEDLLMPGTTQLQSIRGLHNKFGVCHRDQMDLITTTIEEAQQYTLSDGSFNPLLGWTWKKNNTLFLCTETMQQAFKNLECRIGLDAES